MDTNPMIGSKHEWGKDFDANCTNFREEVRGWRGYLSYAAGSPAISADIRQYPTIELWSDAGWATSASPRTQVLRVNPT